MRCLVALALVGCAGCELVTAFDLRRAAETTNALCSDGVDNDGNGLTDCQDWKCLGLPACCNMPVVVLADDFGSSACASASCAAPDSSCAADGGRWQAWGSPKPLLCEGSFSPHKSELCYDVGVVSLQPLPLHPGLSVTAHVIGGHETGARLTVGLTLQSQPANGITACSPIEPPSAVVAVRLAPSANGYTLSATFDRFDLAAAPEISDTAAHEVRLSISDDRRVHYAVDGLEFAQSPADQPFPDSSPSAFVLLAGRGLSPRVDDVRVVDGTQCEAPSAWQKETPAVALDAENIVHGWDDFAVFSPAVVPARDGAAQVYFTGCEQAGSGGCSSNFGIGRAVSANDQPLARDADNPHLSPRRRVTLEVGWLRSDPPQDPPRGFLTSNVNAADESLILEPTTDDPVTHMGEKDPPVLRPGPAGSWDDADVCCASAVARDNRVLLWYAGRSKADRTWRVGLATSTDGGVSFVREPTNPVLTTGALGDFDAQGVTEPEVVFDAGRQLYRMWYSATAFLGVSALGYAVSTDGVRWQKYPGNPVLSLDAAGLDTIGSPAVLAEEGRLRLWVTGHETGRSGNRIYGFTNRGQPPAH